MFDMVEDMLSGLTGVIDVSQILKKDLRLIEEKELTYSETHLVKLGNLGIRLVLKRDYVFVLLKDSHFRRPPSPTVYMVEDLNDTYVSSLNTIEVNSYRYHIIGEEIFDKEAAFREKTVFISSGFVLFPERRKGRTNVPAYFLIPPIKFPELDSKREVLQIDHVMSISPSSVTDDYLRNSYNLSKSPEYATILVGFDCIV